MCVRACACSRVLLGRIESIRCGLLLPIFRGLCVSVGHSHITMNSAETDEPIVESAPNSLYSRNSAGGTTVHDTHSCSLHCLVPERVGLEQ